MMAELEPTRKKSTEQFPLLQAVEGGGDGTRVHTSRSRLSRCSEYTSACWMTLMLLMIAMLGVYSLGMAVNKRQAVLVKYLHERYRQHVRHHRIGEPAVDVFYMKIVSPEQDNPFDQYSVYLSDMALKYPYLRFNVFFLVDDTLVPKVSFKYNNRRFFKNNKNRRSIFYPEKSRQSDFANFMKTYPNVNITTELLGKHMLTTPLKTRLWRIVPTQTIQFYCGVHAVWKYGGIALDLDAFNDAFRDQQLPDRRIKMIFDRHNDRTGVRRNDLDSVPAISCESDDDDSLFLVNFYSVVSTFLPNGTESKEVAVLNDTTDDKRAEPLVRIEEKQAERFVRTDEKPADSLVRKHRDKRELSESIASLFNSQDIFKKKNIIFTTELEPNITTYSATDLRSNTDPNINTEATPGDVELKVPITAELDKSETSIFPKKELTSSFNPLSSLLTMLFNLDFVEHMMVERSPNRPADPSSLAVSESPKLEPAHQPWDPARRAFGEKRPDAEENQGNRLVVLEADGKFVSSTVRYHAFLGRMMYQVIAQTDPRKIFENVLATNCYGPFREASYCADVYFL